MQYKSDATLPVRGGLRNNWSINFEKQLLKIACLDILHFWLERLVVKIREPVTDSIREPQIQISAKFK